MRTSKKCKCCGRKIYLVEQETNASLLCFFCSSEYLGIDGRYKKNMTRKEVYALINMKRLELEQLEAINFYTLEG